MTTKDAIIGSVNQWVGGIAMELAPQLVMPKTKTTTFISNLLGIDLDNYSILGEFSFLVPELIEGPVRSKLEPLLDNLGLDDKGLNDYFYKIVKKCITQIDETEKPINIYGLTFEKKSFENLLSIYKEMKKSSN